MWIIKCKLYLSKCSLFSIQTFIVNCPHLFAKKITEICVISLRSVVELEVKFSICKTLSSE